MVGSGKIMGLVLGIILLGALSPIAFGYFDNITSSLTGAGYGWAATIVIIGIVFGLVKLFMPRR